MHFQQVYTANKQTITHPGNPNTIITILWNFNRPNLLHSEIVKIIKNKIFFVRAKEREICYLNFYLNEAQILVWNVRNSINRSGITPRIHVRLLTLQSPTPILPAQTSFHHSIVLKSMGYGVIQTSVNIQNLPHSGCTVLG